MPTPFFSGSIEGTPVPRGGSVTARGPRPPLRKPHPLSRKVQVKYAFSVCVTLHNTGISEPTIFTWTCDIKVVMSLPAGCPHLYSWGHTGMKMKNARTAIVGTRVSHAYNIIRGGSKNLHKGPALLSLRLPSLFLPCLPFLLEVISP